MKCPLAVVRTDERRIQELATSWYIHIRKNISRKLDCADFQNGAVLGFWPIWPILTIFVICGDFDDFDGFRGYGGLWSISTLFCPITRILCFEVIFDVVRY